MPVFNKSIKIRCKGAPAAERSPWSSLSKIKPIYDEKIVILPAAKGTIPGRIVTVALTKPGAVRPVRKSSGILPGLRHETFRTKPKHS